MLRSIRFILLVSLAMVTLPVTSRAQRPDVPASFMTRAELQTRAQEAQRLADMPSTNAATREAKRAEARAIRDRLSQGDFKVGDRIYLRVAGQPTLTDTFDIRSGLELRLPGYDALVVAGSLRSELNAKVTDHVARLLKNPNVTVVPLLRVSVTGAVGRPGFYNLPTDALLSDAIMRAGGPAANGDLNKVEVRRGTAIFLAPEKTRDAMNEGKSLDQLKFEGGEAVIVPTVHKMSWSSIVQAAVAVVGAASLIISLSR